MELSEMLNYILYVVLTVIMPVVAKYAVDLIKAKIKESNIIEEATKNENVSSLIKEALDNVMDAVLYVNQTFTESLKKKGEFNEEAWEEARKKAYNAALETISEESKNAVTMMYGSFDKWLELKIESSVNVAKK